MRLGIITDLKLLWQRAWRRAVREPEWVVLDGTEVLEPSFETLGKVVGLYGRLSHHKPNHSAFPQRKINRKAAISIVCSYCRIRETTFLRLPPHLLRCRPTIRHSPSQAHAYVSITTSYMIELAGELRLHPPPSIFLLVFVVKQCVDCSHVAALSRSTATFSLFSLWYAAPPSCLYWRHH